MHALIVAFGAPGGDETANAPVSEQLRAHRKQLSVK